MEKVMSKTNDTVRKLQDDELENVSGGSKLLSRDGQFLGFRLDPAPFSIDIGTSENLVVRRP